MSIFLLAASTRTTETELLETQREPTTSDSSEPRGRGRPGGSLAGRRWRQKGLCRIANLATLGREYNRVSLRKSFGKDFFKEFNPSRGQSGKI